MTRPIRLAMWSGPRNISTAMMRSFGARSDTDVIDEPFYAVYLARTGLDHPMREEVLASQPQEWRDVVDTLLSETANDRAVFYQKHMTHHMLPGIGCEWMAECRNAFLIRDPADVLASYAVKRSDVTLSDIGIVRQRELFEREADRLGSTPAVIDGADVLNDPKRRLTLLCTALGIEFQEDMLRWPAGRRHTDGVWAPAWYAAVERSTCFDKPSGNQKPPLSDELKRIAAAALPHYEALAKHRLR